MVDIKIKVCAAAASQLFVQCEEEEKIGPSVENQSRMVSGTSMY